MQTKLCVQDGNNLYLRRSVNKVYGTQSQLSKNVLDDPDLLLIFLKLSEPFRLIKGSIDGLDNLFFIGVSAYSNRSIVILED